MRAAPGGGPDAGCLGRRGKGWKARSERSPGTIFGSLLLGNKWSVTALFPLSERKYMIPLFSQLLCKNEDPVPRVSVACGLKTRAA